jgi:hypothetical protein
MRSKPAENSKALGPSRGTFFSAERVQKGSCAATSSDDTTLSSSKFAARETRSGTLWTRRRSTEQASRGPTGWHIMVSAASEFILEVKQRCGGGFLFVEHFRQIFSSVTPNGRGPARFQDARDVMFVPFIKKY